MAKVMIELTEVMPDRMRRASSMPRRREPVKTAPPSP